MEISGPFSYPTNIKPAQSSPEIDLPSPRDSSEDIVSISSKAIQLSESNLESPPEKLGESTPTPYP